MSMAPGLNGGQRGADAVAGGLQGITEFADVVEIVGAAGIGAELSGLAGVGEGDGVGGLQLGALADGEDDAEADVGGR